jgi:Ni/Co efflux regulator RcnB
MKVKAPKGYHWMKVGKTFKLMKNTGKFVKHKGASLEANFPIQKVHKK